MRTSPRRLAFEVIAETELNGGYSNLLLPKRLRDSDLEARDRGFVTELVYGTIRMKGKCEYFISQVSDRPIHEIDPKVLIVLRIGVYQLVELGAPAHAAVNETVELAKQVVGRSASSFVNALLRRIERESSTIELPLSQRFSHPDWIINAYRDALKTDSEVELLLQANNEAATPTLIAWPGLSTQEELLSAGATPISGSTVAASFDGNPSEIEAIRKRRAGVQDYGSQLVVELFFGSSSGTSARWLDLCAGPGGKAAYLDALIHENSCGDFVANEISEERARLVSQVVHHGKITNFDGRTLPAVMGDFDRILIDAPCTGLGALRRRPEVRWRRQPGDLAPLRHLQSELLDSAAARLTRGGVIGYATCSPHLAETKHQVKAFLLRHPNFRRRTIESPLADNDGDMQLWTHRDGTDAMYLALLEKVDG